MIPYRYAIYCACACQSFCPHQNLCVLLCARDVNQNFKSNLGQRPRRVPFYRRKRNIRKMVLYLYCRYLFENQDKNGSLTNIQNTYFYVCVLLSTFLSTVLLITVSIAVNTTFGMHCLWSVMYGCGKIMYAFYRAWLLFIYVSSRLLILLNI